MITKDRAEKTPLTSTLYLSAKLVRLGHRLAAEAAYEDAAVTEATRFVGGMLVLTGALVELAAMAPDRTTSY